MLMLLDYDGVIVDSFDHLLDLCVQVWESLGCGRCPTARDFRTIENLAFADLACAIGAPGDKAPLFAARVLELQKADWPVRLFPGMRHALCALAVRHTLAVITSSRSETVAASLRNAGLGDAISAVLGGDLGTSKAERIGAMRARHGESRGATFMIGDTIGDIREGKRAGVRTVAVGWGYQTAALLSKEAPDFLINKPSDLLQLAGRPLEDLPAHAAARVVCSKREDCGQ